MARRSRLKSVKQSRNAGHRPKHNKKSVEERRRLRIERNRRTKNDELI